MTENDADDGDVGKVNWFRRVLKVKGVKDGGSAGKIVGIVFGVCFASAMFFSNWTRDIDWKFLLALSAIIIGAGVVGGVAGSAAGYVTGRTVTGSFREKLTPYGLNLVDFFAGAVGFFVVTILIGTLLLVLFNEGMSWFDALCFLAETLVWSFRMFLYVVCK